MPVATSLHPLKTCTDRVFSTYWLLGKKTCICPILALNFHRRETPLYPVPSNWFPSLKSCTVYNFTTSFQIISQVICLKHWILDLSLSLSFTFPLLDIYKQIRTVSALCLLRHWLNATLTGFSAVIAVGVTDCAGERHGLERGQLPSLCKISQSRRVLP